MRFEWDSRKNRANFRKHYIPLELAQEVFEDPFCLTIADRVVEGEQRWWTVGSIQSSSIVVVVHTILVEEDDELIRIISARKATRRERRLYEEENG
jgi:uncharacterized protein